MMTWFWMLPASALGHPLLQLWPEWGGRGNSPAWLQYHSSISSGLIQLLDNSREQSAFLNNISSWNLSEVHQLFGRNSIKLVPVHLFLGGISNFSWLELILVLNRDWFLCSQSGSSGDLIFHNSHLRKRNSFYGRWQWDSLVLCALLATCSQSGVSAKTAKTGEITCGFGTLPPIMGICIYPTTDKKNCIPNIFNIYIDQTPFTFRSLIVGFLLPCS